MTDTQAPPPGTRLGVVDVELIRDRTGGGYMTHAELRSASGGVARGVPLIIGALLFAQRQMRPISDPARLETVARLQEAVNAARAGRLAPPKSLTNPRTVASFQIAVTANGAFGIQVEQKLDGLLADEAGPLAISALAEELLSSLPEPYRAFYGEMLQAALPSWRERRPPLGESTWNWSVALRRLDALVRADSASGDEPVVCPDCKALRQPNSACLRCGSTAEPAPTIAHASSILPASEGPETVVVRPAAEPEVPRPPALPPIVPRETPLPPLPEPAQATADPAVTTYDPNVAPAQDFAPGQVVQQPEPRFGWPLARLPRRLGAAIVDLIIAAILGVIGGFGATTLALATGGITNDQAGAFFFPSVVVIIATLYFVLGWSSNEAVGMLVFRLRLLRPADRKPGGFLRAVARAVGYFIALAIGLAIMFVGLFIDARLPFIVGTADTIYQIILGLIALYVVWSLTGQRILTGSDRQTIGDQLARTIVAFSPRGSGE